MDLYDGVQLMIDDAISDFIPKEVSVGVVSEYCFKDKVCCNCNAYESDLKAVMVNLFLDNGIIVRPKVKMCHSCYVSCRDTVNKRIKY